MTLQAMMFVNFSKELDSFQSNYKDAATLYKGKGISFLLGDVDVTQNAFQVLLPPGLFCLHFFSFSCMRVFPNESKPIHIFLSFVAVLWTQGGTGTCAYHPD